MQRQEVESKIGFLVCQAQFFANINAMKFYGPCGRIHYLTDFFGRFAPFNQIGDLNFFWRQMGIVCG